MLKRSLSPSPHPEPTKRSRHIHQPSSAKRFHTLTLDARSLSDELFLYIFAFLSPWDLSNVERVDRHFMRLANDPMLWKKLYLSAHPYPNLRGYRPSTQSRSLASTIASGRPVVRLTPRAMANLLPTPPIDWKWMFKVSTNWSSGRSSLHPLLSTPTAPPPSPPAYQTRQTPSFQESSASSYRVSSQPTTLVALSSPLIFSASRKPTTRGLPEIKAFLAKDSAAATEGGGDGLFSFHSAGLEDERERGWVRGAVSVVDLAVDGAGWTTLDEDAESADKKGVRLYISFSSGAFSIFLVSSSSSSTSSSARASDFSVVETYFSPSPTVAPLNLPLISALHASLLVTCTPSFLLSFYTLLDGSITGAGARLTSPLRPFRTLRSHTSWFPAALLLGPPSPPTILDADNEEEDDDDSFLLLTVAYTVPVYPSSFSVAIQEIGLSPPTPLTPTWRCTSERALSALVGSSGSTSGTLAGEIGTVGSVTGVGLDERWVCLAGGDNRVQVFERPPPGEANARLVFKGTLWAHNAGVTSISCLDGRCITADATGRLFIWSLDLPFSPTDDFFSATAFLSAPSATNDDNTNPSSDLDPFSTSTSTIPSRLSSPVPPPPPRRPTFVEVSVPRPAPPERAERVFSWGADSGRGRERVVWVGQDVERIVSVGLPREDLQVKDGSYAEDGRQGVPGEGAVERVRVWSF